MKRFKNLIYLSLCGVFFLSCACGSTSEISEKSSDKSSSAGDSSLKKEKFSYTVDNSGAGDYGYGYYIEGIVTNNTDKDYSYVQITFTCYDKDGNNLGTAMDNTNNLLGNQTWKYKAAYLGTDGKEIDHCDYYETTSW